MAERVFLHVGLPKTGTTYLQSVLWANKPLLRERGVLVPGARPRDHMRASIVVRQHPKLEGKQDAVRGSWSRLLDDMARFEGTAVVSHEFFSVASAEQARLAVSQIDADEVHVVVTARDVLRIVSSYWQEYLKHGFDKRLDFFPNPETPDWSEWGWAALDLESVLRRWGSAVPPERLHLVVLPEPGAPPEQLFETFARVVGFDTSGLDMTGARENASLSLVEAELLRRVTRELEGFTSALDRGVWLRHYLAHEKLVPREGDRFLPSPERIAELRAVAADAVAYIREHDFDVVGDVDRLLVPDELPWARHPDSVTDAEMLTVAIATINSMLADVKTFRQERNALAQQVARLEGEVTRLRRVEEAASEAAAKADAEPPQPERARLTAPLRRLLRRLR